MGMERSGDEGKCIQVFWSNRLDRLDTLRIEVNFPEVESAIQPQECRLDQVG